MKGLKHNDKLLIRIRKQFLTQDAFGKALGKRGNTQVSGVIHGRINLTPGEWKEWAGVLNCEVEDIFPEVEARP